MSPYGYPFHDGDLVNRVIINQDGTDSPIPKNPRSGSWTTNTSIM
jgi:hypothetical protein